MMRLRQIAIFLCFFALILGLTHYYIHQRVSYFLQLDAAQSTTVGVALGLFACLSLLALPLSRMLPREKARLISWIAYPWMGFAFLTFIGFLITEIVWLVLNVIDAYTGTMPSLRTQTQYGVVTLGIVTALSAYALWQGLRPVQVHPITIHLKKLPPQLDGLRLAQITDLHVGPTLGRSWVQDVVNRTNALQADIIVITGDLIDGSLSDLRHHIEPLGQLRAPHGVYFITGNHEYYSGVEDWCGFVESIGITLLRNRRVSLTINNHSIDLAGVDDWSSGHFPGEGPDLTKALTGRDTTKPVILLAHQPLAAHEAAKQGVDLQLSGHTHGGQIWPFHYLIYLQQPYNQGLFQYPNAALQLYVSTGTGFWGPPMRLGAPAEITHITLRTVT
jgi:predicted MPP superfamily phosphohydrolase